MNIAAEARKALFGLEAAILRSGLEHSLLHLVKLRASQLNHCAYCIDMHWKEARAAGESEQRLYGLTAWRENRHYYSERELAALAWTDAVTFLHEGHVPDAVHEVARAEFDEKDLANLTFALVAINGWNRLCVSFRVDAGDYKVSGHPVAAEK